MIGILVGLVHMYVIDVGVGIGNLGDWRLSSKVVNPCLSLLYKSETPFMEHRKTSLVNLVCRRVLNACLEFVIHWIIETVTLR